MNISYAPSGGMPRKPSKNIDELMLVWGYYNVHAYGSLEDILEWHKKNPHYSKNIKDVKGKIKYFFKKCINEKCLEYIEEDEKPDLEAIFNQCPYNELPPWDD